MTPREIQAAMQGWARAEREKAALHPMASFDSEREAQRFIEGRSQRTLPPDEQQRQLDRLKDRIDS